MVAESAADRKWLYACTLKLVPFVAPTRETFPPKAWVHGCASPVRVALSPLVGRSGLENSTSVSDFLGDFGLRGWLSPESRTRPTHFHPECDVELLCGTMAGGLGKIWIR